MNFESSERTPIDDQISRSTQPMGGDAAAAKPAVANKRPDEMGEKLAAEMLVFQRLVDELKAKRDSKAPLQNRFEQIVSEATELFGVAPTWTAFYRETVGVEGSVRALLCNNEEMLAYEDSQACCKIMEMLTVLRSRDLPDCDPSEPQRMITVRLPKSLHDHICWEANDLKVSVNKLCITRMLQRVDRKMIPTSTKKRRGRRPGADYTRSTTESRTSTESTTTTESRTSTESHSATEFRASVEAHPSAQMRPSHSGPNTQAMAHESVGYLSE